MPERDKTERFLIKQQLSMAVYLMQIGGAAMLNCMFHRVDDFIIDRVFQPVSDALAWKTSCYNLSFYFLFVASVWQVIMIILLPIVDLPYSGGRAVQVLAVLCSLSWSRFVLLRAAALVIIKPLNTIPYVRMEMFSMRVLIGILWLFFIVHAVIILILVSVFFEWPNSLGVITGSLQMCGVYFMACVRRLPPAKRTISLHMIPNAT
jgi:hypothetical protein